MSDETILQYLKNIDDRTTRMEDKQDAVNTDHDKRLKSLENSRTATRAGIAALTIGGGTGAAKAGLVDKIISMLGGS